ncbi:unnamed protein product, partial [Amoebophrya sp. A25]|eukprot:GSA25T00018500001.1
MLKKVGPDAAGKAAQQGQDITPENESVLSLEDIQDAEEDTNYEYDEESTSVNEYRNMPPESDHPQVSGAGCRGLYVCREFLQLAAVLQPEEIFIEIDPFRLTRMGLIPGVSYSHRILADTGEAEGVQVRAFSPSILVPPEYHYAFTGEPQSIEYLYPTATGSAGELFCGARGEKIQLRTDSKDFVGNFFPPTADG